MSCPQLFFEHVPPSNLTTDITISTSRIVVGSFTYVSVTLHNGSVGAGLGQVQIYWSPVSLSTGLPCGPYTPVNTGAYPNPTSAQTIAGENPFTWADIPWCPDNTVVPPPGTDQSHLALFATAIAPPNPPSCSGEAFPGDYNWLHRWNGAQVFLYGA